MSGIQGDFVSQRDDSKRTASTDRPVTATIAKKSSQLAAQLRRREPREDGVSEKPVRVGASPGPINEAPYEEVEEFFRGVVESFDADELSLRTVSSQGEEGFATLPVSAVPVHERKYIAVGASLRISVVVEYGPPRRRMSRVRFLRPAQTYQPGAEYMKASDFLMQRMQKVLAR